MLKDCDCKSLLGALGSIREDLNLVPGMLVVAKQISAPAAATNRETVKLPKHGPRVRAFVAVVRARATLTGADAAVMQFLFNHFLDAGQAETDLDNGAGMYLSAGASYEQAFPAWYDEITLDYTGKDAADFDTDAEITGTLHVLEMVSAYDLDDKRRGC